MVKFTFDSAYTNQQYIQISAVFSTKESITFIQLPSWRPGRYELGNFAKNVRNFKIFDANNKPLSHEKRTKDRWEVDTSNTDSIRVSYSYFAHELNAGSSFLDETQLYVNPVNCCVYTDETFEEEVEVSLKIPAAWEVATSMNQVGEVWKAENTEELLDSPFICSAKLQHQSYTSGETLFHVWFNGEIKPDWERLLKDFKAFTDAQIEKFFEFPVKEYHFLNQIVPIKAYHGVEHQKSTVILLGPSYEVFGDFYSELLGVSSHELYHTWNVKAIRPIEMFPYNYTKENYSKLGYICEGVTTYQGDLFLLKSGVFDVQAYFKELTAQLQKHFDNAARFHYSVADSSFDTWLDGYVPGAPGRKVSIYVEGCLLAFVTDVMIRKATENKYGLDEVMKQLYFNFAMQGKGVSESDYQATIEGITRTSFQDFFDDYIHGTRPYESILVDAFNYLGIEMTHEASPIYSEGKLGFKTVKGQFGFTILSMFPGGPAEIAGLAHADEIIAVNGFPTDLELNKWLAYFDADVKTLTVRRAGRILDFKLPEVNRNFYNIYGLKRLENPDVHQQKAFKNWIK
jgi:predicted metalloprotease with PDZ domain